MRRIIVSLLFLFYATLAHGEVTLDGTASTTTASGVDEVTFAHTTAGSNRLLIVCVGHLGTDVAVTGIVYAGIAMTLVEDEFVATGISLYCYQLVAPSTGSNNVVISLDGNGLDIVTGAISFNGVHQTVPVGTAATSNEEGTPTSTDVTVSANGMAVDFLVMATTEETITVGAGQTERASQN